MTPPKNSNKVPKASTSGKAKRQCASLNAAADSPKRLRYDPESKSAENHDKAFCHSVGLSQLRFPKYVDNEEDAIGATQEIEIAYYSSEDDV